MTGRRSIEDRLRAKGRAGQTAVERAGIALGFEIVDISLLDKILAGWSGTSVILRWICSLDVCMVQIWNGSSGVRYEKDRLATGKCQ